MAWIQQRKTEDSQAQSACLPAQGPSSASLRCRVQQARLEAPGARSRHEDQTGHKEGPCTQSVLNS